MTARRVAVTGLGLVSPYGGNLPDFFSRLMDGESAVHHLQTDDVPRPLSMPFVTCRDFDARAALGGPLAAMMERFAHLGLAAAFDAWADAGLERQPCESDTREDWGCVWGTALGGIQAFERGYKDIWLKGRERLSPLSVVMGMNNAVNAHISIQLGLGGVSSSHAAACASSAIAIGEAYRRIRAGHASVMLTGGSDATQTYGVAQAWLAMRLMSPDVGDAAAQACRPFAANRAGLVLGEGGVALVLEDWEHARARGAAIHAEMVGYGVSCDHTHLVRPDAGGQARAIRAALAEGGLAPEDVDYVNAHGTATPEGDPIEIHALQQVFGNHAAHLPVSATKSMHGHLMGAAGAMEALATVLSVREQALPPTAHLEGRLDPACEGVDHILRGRHDVRVRAALSNSFAFGGSNAVLAFRQASIQ
ncbi:beta-ketoacyl-[acyl-carrier-protein] synthase family protein [Pulveribacter sp.]|uniref:beta-ketoacyl-[acyl-carrier-protein] synthase family protein n=1 Tax=Pulveribacter sp. TaxID=2678893 RepID=UPI0028997855|nr:beta-ketoacyl-[acyl-carrier-protein] synthase family protein [Pulveribacter sp.]